MSLREDCIKEWFKDLQGKSFETRMDATINKVLDKAVEAAYREMIPKSHDLAIEKVVLAIRRLKNA